MIRKASEVAGQVFQAEHKFRAVMNRKGPGGEEVITADRLSIVARLREMVVPASGMYGDSIALSTILERVCNDLADEIHSASETGP